MNEKEGDSHHDAFVNIDTHVLNILSAFAMLIVFFSQKLPCISSRSFNDVKRLTKSSNISLGKKRKTNCINNQQASKQKENMSENNLKENKATTLKVKMHCSFFHQHKLKTKENKTKQNKTKHNKTIRMYR